VPSYTGAALSVPRGGNGYPAIELENGTVYRDESAHMVKTIRAGELFATAGAAPPADASG